MQELPTLPIFVTEKVHVGIERNRAIPANGGQAAVIDAWAVHGIWWIGFIRKVTDKTGRGGGYLYMLGGRV